MAKPEEKLKRAIEGTGLAEVLQLSSNIHDDPYPEVRKVVAQARVQSEDKPDWLGVVDFMLQEEENQDDDDEQWSLHVCQTYLRNKDRLGFVWTVSLTTRFDPKRAINDLSRAIRTISAGMRSNPQSQTASMSFRPTPKGPQNAIQRAAQAVATGSISNQGASAKVHRVGDRVEVEEMPLIGVTDDRNRPDGPNSKGARYINGR